MQLVIDNTGTIDREIVLTRILKAPRELVFKAWTDPKHLVNWWGPAGFTNTFLEADIRPGGKWRFIMQGPNGVNSLCLVIFTELIKPERLAYEFSSGDENDPDRFKVIVTFEEQGRKTRLTMLTIFPCAIRDLTAREHCAVEGGNQTIDKLEQELLKM
jgi:uncharacterized protein YndB with AHSA1/START domain